MERPLKYSSSPWGGWLRSTHLRPSRRRSATTDLAVSGMAASETVRRKATASYRPNPSHRLVRQPPKADVVIYCHRWQRLWHPIDGVVAGGVHIGPLGTLEPHRGKRARTAPAGSSGFGDYLPCRFSHASISEISVSWSAMILWAIALVAGSLACFSATFAIATAPL